MLWSWTWTGQERIAIPFLRCTMVMAVRSLFVDTNESQNASCYSTGSAVARFAGQNVHKRLVSEDSYREKDYPTSLKKAFLGTDEDLLASKERYNRFIALI